MQIITTTKEVKDACRKLSKDAFVTIDTEFIRDTTYWPELCLIQLGGADETYLIDPLADGIELGAFYQLLKNKSVVKVFHAARQDIEIFFHQAKTIPSPLFDTQVAAMVCGFGDSVGYETLIKKTVNVTLDKSSRFSDWRRRPLSKKQLDYAAADVIHLRPAYEAIAKQVEEANRVSWLDEELGILCDPKTYSLKPEEAWTRLKIRNKRPRAIAILQHIAAWREAQAQERNMPRSRILKDDALQEIAVQAPRDKSELENLRAVPNGFSRSSGAKTLLAAVETGLAIPKKDLPAQPKPFILPNGLTPVVELLKVLLKMKCEEHGVAPKLVANVADLERLAADDNAEIPALNGWRREVFGEAAIRLKKGKIVLGLTGRRVVTMTAPSPAKKTSARPKRSQKNAASD